MKIETTPASGKKTANGMAGRRTGVSSGSVNEHLHYAKRHGSLLCAVGRMHFESPADGVADELLKDARIGHVRIPARYREMAMVQKLFYELPADERESFESACARHGFVQQDFDVAAEEGAPLAGGPSHTPREITVARVIGGEVRRYPDRAGSSWIAAFEQDLARDVFGFPLAD